MGFVVYIVLIVLTTAAAFVFIPALQGVFLPMPGTIRRLVRESAAKPPPAGNVHTDLVYHRDWARRQRLDIYEPLAPYAPVVAPQPTGPSGAEDGAEGVSGARSGAEELRPPLVVFLHGGSWIHGDKITIRVVDRFLRRMREEGFFVAAVNYTTTLLRGFAGPVSNTERALEWLGENADRFGYDPHNMGLYGVSSGGHLALLVGSTMECGSCSFAFLFGECAPTDLVAMREGDAFENSRSFRFFRTEELRRLSPMSYVERPEDAGTARQLPPILLYHGAADRTVHVRQAERYAAAVEAAGGDVELVVYPEGDHAFLNMSDDAWYEQETRGLRFFRERFAAVALGRTTPGRRDVKPGRRRGTADQPG
jgi:acetyl esterase/lipase